MICDKCKKEFDEKEQEVKVVKLLRIFRCPECNNKYQWINHSGDYKRNKKTGQLLRKNKRVRKTKKERREYEKD